MKTEHEIIYSYTKGVGWQPGREDSALRNHGGKLYRVTILKRPPSSLERGCNAWNCAETIEWWDSWENNKNEWIPAGFGFGTSGDRDELFTVVTEPL